MLRRVGVKFSVINFIIFEIYKFILFFYFIIIYKTEILAFTFSLNYWVEGGGGGASTSQGRDTAKGGPSLGRACWGSLLKLLPLGCRWTLREEVYLLLLAGWPPEHVKFINKIRV